MKKIINYSIYAVFIFGILGAGNLAYTEFLHEGTCPKLGIIPACYVIFGCLLIPFVTHIFNKGKAVYFLFTSFALAILQLTQQLANYLVKCSAQKWKAVFRCAMFPLEFSFVWSC